jgi:hypothetical protein
MYMGHGYARKDPQESVSASMPSTRDTCHELLSESVPSAKYCWRGILLDSMILCLDLDATLSNVSGRSVTGILEDIS